MVWTRLQLQTYGSDTQWFCTLCVWRLSLCWQHYIQEPCSGYDSVADPDSHMAFNTTSPISGPNSTQTSLELLRVKQLHTLHAITLIWVDETAHAASVCLYIIRGHSQVSACAAWTALCSAGSPDCSATHCSGVSDMPLAPGSISPPFS